jgi:hypothetical protein
VGLVALSTPYAYKYHATFILRLSHVHSNFVSSIVLIVFTPHQSLTAPLVSLRNLQPHNDILSSSLALSRVGRGKKGYSIIMGAPSSLFFPCTRFVHDASRGPNLHLDFFYRGHFGRWLHLRVRVIWPNGLFEHLEYFHSGEPLDGLVQLAICQLDRRAKLR